MGISKKTLIIVAAILGCIILTLFFYLRFFVLENYIEIEKIEITNRIIHSTKIIGTSIDNLDKNASIYASLAETYDYLNETNKESIEKNINNEFFSNLGINLFALIDNKNNIKFISCYDTSTQKITTIPEKIKEELIKDKYLVGKSSQLKSLSGIIILDNNPYFFVSKPVSTISRTSFPNGTLMMGKLIDKKIIDQIASGVGNPVNLYMLESDEVQSEFETTISKLLGGNSYEIKYNSRREISGYTIIKDMDSTPVLLLEILSPRTIYTEGQTTIYTFFIILVITGLLSCLTIFLVLEKLVLSRIVTLSSRTEEIGNTKDLSKIISFKGNDEIARLTVSINNMLRELKGSELDIKKSEKRFKDLVELLPEIVIETNTEQKITFANRSFFEVFGYYEEDLQKSLYISEILTPSDFKKSSEKISLLVSGQKTESSEYTAIRKDGSTLPILVSSIAIYDENNSFMGFRSIIVDITKRKEEEERLKELEERWEFALEGSGDGVWDWDFDSNKVFYSRRFKEILGFEEYELKNNLSEIMDRINPEDYQNVIENINKHLKGETHYYIAEYRIMHKDGNYIWAQDRGKVIRWDGNGKPLRMIGTFTDITVRKKLEEEIKNLAYRDPLTNLPNRLLFNDRIDLTIASSKRNNKKFALMIIDIDKFKKINDTYGHDIGDKLILYVGSKILALIRKSDTISRFGGDEFLLLLPDIKSKEDSEKIAEKILGNFKEKTVVDGRKFITTLSIGIAVYPDDGNDSTTLLKNADIALYDVKDSGRNDYRFYSANLIQPI
jgi:diguanylate cyclase (GGDEF)-like protein/PAS domain S-box-containing protein